MAYLAHIAGWETYNLHDSARVSGSDLYFADPTQSLTTAGEELDYTYDIIL